MNLHSWGIQIELCDSTKYQSFRQKEYFVYPFQITFSDLLTKCYFYGKKYFRELKIMISTSEKNEVV